jgi:hypothetical protein
MYIYSISISTSEILSRFDFEIYEVGYQKHIAVDVNVVSYWKNN